MASTIERPAGLPAALSAPWTIPAAQDTQEAGSPAQARQSVPPRGTAGVTRRPAARKCDGECGRAIERRSRSGLCKICRAERSAKVPCKGTRRSLVTEANPTGACDALVAPANKTGQCRECWRESVGRNGAKTDPFEQAAMLERMVRSFARRSVAEDPGIGLAALLELAGKVGDLAETVGMKLTAELGSSLVARELGHDRRVIDKRWGPAARAEKDGWDR
jgi:hypothetical protein